MLICSNAKINIGLRVVSRRNDGYHNISSFIYPLYRFHDLIEVVERTDGKKNSVELICSGIKLPIADKDNLCVRAYHLLADRYNFPAVSIHLHKVIPVGSGFGGGSSNGAHTLRILNELFDLGLSKNELISFALQLGSDCPFFIGNVPAIVSGRGEVPDPIEMDLSGYEIRTMVPSFAIDTPSMFAKVEPSMFRQPFSRDLPAKDNWKEELKNDFEGLAFEQFPELKKIRDQLYRQGAIYASMSGTGSGIFGIFPNHSGK